MGGICRPQGQPGLGSNLSNATSQLCLQASYLSTLRLCHPQKHGDGNCASVPLIEASWESIKMTKYSQVHL